MAFLRSRPSVYEQFQSRADAQEVMRNDPDAVALKANMDLKRMDSEATRRNQAMAMALEYKKHDWQRHMDLVGAESEYLSAMGQETKAPTDPRLTQTHKAAVAKGQYARQTAQSAAAAARQAQNLELAKLIQKGEQFGTKEKRYGVAQEEAARHNLATESIGRSRAASAGRLRDSFNAQRTIQALNGLLGKIDTEIRAAAGTAQAPGRQGIDDERVRRLMAERDKVAALLKSSIAQATQMSGVAAQLGAIDTGGVAGMETYGAGVGGGAPQGEELREEDFPFEG